MDKTAAHHKSRTSGCFYRVSAMNYIQELQLTRAGPQFIVSACFVIQASDLTHNWGGSCTFFHFFPYKFCFLLYYILLQCLETRKSGTVSPPPSPLSLPPPPPSLSSLQGKQQQIEQFVSDVLRGYNTKQCWYMLATSQLSASIFFFSK